MVFEPAGRAADASRSAGDVEPAGGAEKRIHAHLRQPADTEDQVVVLPELVGQQHHVALVDEQVGHDAQGVGHAAGNHRQRELLAGQAGVLLSRASRHSFRRSSRPAAGA